VVARSNWRDCWRSFVQIKLKPWR